MSRGHHQTPSQIALNASMLKKLKSISNVEAKSIAEGDENSSNNK